MPFNDPRDRTPKDGERIQYKVTGDPKVLGLQEPTTGHFIATNPQLPSYSKLLGHIIDDKTNEAILIWREDEIEVASWRPYDEYLAELH